MTRQKLSGAIFFSMQMIYVLSVNKNISMKFKNFCDIGDWFVDNKLSIHFGEDKTKSILLLENQKEKFF